MPQRSELEDRIVNAAALPPTFTDIQIVFQSGSLPSGSIFFPDVLYLAQTMRRFLGACRPIEPQDLTTPENNAAKAGGAIDFVDLKSRTTTMLANLSSDISALQTAALGFQEPLIPSAPRFCDAVCTE